jgi:hypothetical protein
MLRASRGQSLLEAIVALALVTGALGLLALAASRASLGSVSEVARTHALDGAANAAVEAIAATEYDPVALGRVANARWIGSDGVSFEAVVRPGADVRSLVYRVKDATGAAFEIPMTLRQLAPSPDAILEGPSLPPPSAGR